MKTTDFFKTAQRMTAFVVMTLVTAATLTACEKDETTVTKKNTDGGMTITVMDDNSTRATYSGLTTTFETGDAIGIYVFDGTSYIASNIRCEKQSDGTWLPESAIRYNTGYSYYAYYPYHSTPYTPVTSGTADDVNTKFSSFIADASDKFWNADQSTKAAYTASNLMIAKGTTSGTANITFLMKHKRGLVVLQSVDIDAYEFSTNVPYDFSSDTKHFLVKPNVTTTVGDNDYLLSYNEYEKTVLPEQYLTFIVLRNTTFTLEIGIDVTKSMLQSVSYSLDNGKTWNTTENIDRTAVTVSTGTVTTGQRVLWKGQGETMATGETSTKYSHFTTAGVGSYKAAGNIMSLLYGDDFREKKELKNRYNFSYLFSNESNITQGPRLPATTLTNYCYNNMFNGCT